ncbi:unnamed protein product [Soboliphyme baturini]|uniref:Uncharacterized protein n=1 Tax=Soboliphyme baturini TaxID=241478 RepID=A0A183J9K2_9BILA|nr:unnamed protein product [Soboliphyme baturini]
MSWPGRRRHAELHSKRPSRDSMTKKCVFRRHTRRARFGPWPGCCRRRNGEEVCIEETAVIASPPRRLTTPQQQQRFCTPLGSARFSSVRRHSSA